MVMQVHGNRFQTIAKWDFRQRTFDLNFNNWKCKLTRERHLHHARQPFCRKHVKTCQNMSKRSTTFPVSTLSLWIDLEISHSRFADLGSGSIGALWLCFLFFFPFDSKLSSAVFIHCGWHFKRSKIITHFNLRRICWCTERCRHSGQDEPFLKSINIWSSAKELQSRIRSSCAYFLLHQPTQAWSFERQSAAS